MKSFLQEINPELPFVIYKEPNTSILKIIQQNDASLNTSENLEKDGFYFYPFDISISPAVVFPMNKISISEQNLRDFDIKRNMGEITPPMFKKIEDAHIKKVEKAIEILKDDLTGLQKIIISSAITAQVKNFSWETALYKLMKKYDEAMVWIWFHPQVGMWMGATPELLGSFKKDRFETMALAGTLPVNKNELIIWSNKEIREQKLVADFIINQLKDFSEKIEVAPTKTIFQGKIAHIQTGIKTNVSQESAIEIILKLHPTPAVSGLPVEKAMKYIKQIEKDPRKYYTGFLGLKTTGNYKFYVNLRSMEILENELVFYAGGGILQDSDPVKEWEEIKNKTHVLYKILISA
jgi:isochorismate synthase